MHVLTRAMASAAIIAGLVLGMVGCSKGGGSSTPDLFLVSFEEDQRTGLFRDQVLTFEFTTQIDPASVSLDTFQIFQGTSQNPIPFTGLFQVDGNFVYFQPVVDEDTPNRGSTPLNPYGFGENTTYQVKIPSIEDTPTPLQLLRSASGKDIIQSFNGVFSTGIAYAPAPNDPNPTFEPFDAAVYDTRTAPAKGTVTAFDDVLTFTPVPNVAQPPLDPNTMQPDFRWEHPTNVQVQVTFDSVMDPRSFRSQSDGNIRLEFFSNNVWNFIPTTVSRSPNGRTFIFTAATPLANANRINNYRLLIDQSNEAILSRGGKKLVEVVERWDNAQQRMVRTVVDQNYLTFWCAVVAGEDGPFLSSDFPLETFARDNGLSDTDVLFTGGQLLGGPVVTRSAMDTTACSIPANPAACFQALREPLTQSQSSSSPNPNSKGPSKIQFHYNEYQHNPQGVSYKLTNAEALTGMNWGPLCNTVIQATYPKLNIHVMWSDRNSANQNAPAGLPSTTYVNNFDRNPPGFPVRDGSQPYVIAQSQANTPWFPWQFQQPFTDYRYDKGLVWMAWTEQGGTVEQYPRWYSPNNMPNTRMFSAPSATPNPAVGAVGQFTYYWTEFEFKRLRSIGVSKFYRMTDSPMDVPQYNRVVVSPLPQNLPGGTSYTIQYSGAKFNSTQMVGGYVQGSGSPTETTAYSTNITNMNGFPFVGVRVLFDANLDQPGQLPFIDDISFTYTIAP